MSQTDIAISGGGLVGTLLALLLDQQKWRVVVIDPQPVLPHHDGRVLAINRRSLELLQSVGVHITGQSISKVRAYEEHSPWSLNFAADELQQGPDMGHMIAYEDLRAALMQARQVSSIHGVTSTVVSAHHEAQHVNLKLGDGSTLETPLWVGAEGKNSPSRSQHMGIRVSTWDYGQHAIVFHIHHEKPHNGCAFEVFRQNGPVALLPMLGGYHSCVVWNTATPDVLQAKTGDALMEALQDVFSLYGACQLSSPRWMFPLTHLSVSTYIQPRYALVGDAAHVLHPLAGQGVNLGWRDAYVLARTIVEARRCGLDWGSMSVLQGFEKHQKSDHRRLRGVVNGLHHLFALPYGRTLRGMGMGVVNAIPALKRGIIRHAMGYS